MIRRVGDRVLFPGSLGAVQVVNPRGGAAAANWWDPDGDGLSVWAAYQPKGSASLAASYTDLSGNGNNASVGVAPTWDAVNGWKFNGSTQYLTTSFVPEVNQSQAMLIQFSNYISPGTHCLAGTSTSTNYFWVYPKLAGGQSYYGNGGVAVPAGGIQAGNSGVAWNRGYKDGSVHSGAIAADANVPTNPVWIGCRFGLTNPIAAYIQALVIYDTALLPGKVSAVATAMAAL